MYTRRMMLDTEHNSCYITIVNELIRVRGLKKLCNIINNSNQLDKIIASTCLIISIVRDQLNNKSD